MEPMEEEPTVISSPLFGQLVAGPPGSGKTTYCKNIAEIMEKLGRRVITINIDPANDVSLPYKPTIDLSQLVKVEEVMETLNLGPNGGLIYAMEYLEANIDWLFDQIKLHAYGQEVSAESKDSQKTKNPYLLFDCPGE